MSGTASLLRTPRQLLWRPSEPSSSLLPSPSPSFPSPTTHQHPPPTSALLHHHPFASCPSPPINRPHPPPPQGPSGSGSVALLNNSRTPLSLTVPEFSTLRRRAHLERRRIPPSPWFSVSSISLSTVIVKGVEGIIEVLLWSWSQDAF